MPAGKLLEGIAAGVGELAADDAGPGGGSDGAREHAVSGATASAPTASAATASEVATDRRDMGGRAPDYYSVDASKGLGHIGCDVA